MSVLKSIFAAIVLFFSLSQSYAQAVKKTNPVHLGKKVSTDFYYTFTGANSLAEVDSLSTLFYNLRGVSECKIRFKPETKLTEVLLVVTVRSAVAESDKEVAFDGAGLKKILEDHNYVLYNELIRKQYVETGND
jgi:hypothetical protein